MNEELNEELESLYAGLAMLGYIINGDYSPAEIPILAKAMAKRMLEEPVEQTGIVAAKRRYAKEK